MEKQSNGPMRRYAMQAAPRCCAMSKRTGLRCDGPAVRGHRVCRMHGAGGGGQRGNRNAWKHGERSQQTTTLRQMIRKLSEHARAAAG